MGWAKSQIRWAILDESQSVSGEAHTKERKGYASTTNETTLNQKDEGERKDRDFFDILSVTNDVHPDAISRQTLEDFEHFFGLEISDVDNVEAKAILLRDVLYKTVEEVLLERRNASGRGAKPGDAELWAFQAYFVEQRPLYQKAQETGAEYNTLKKAIPRIVDFLYQHREDIRSRVKYNLQQQFS